MSVTAYLALGSNLGDRRALLDGAVAALRAHHDIAVTAVSSYHETDPVGGPAGQQRYLNAAVAIRTALTPELLLAAALDIERRFGRQRGARNAPRTLDLDILLYGDVIRTTPDPIVPHPRLHERLFVLDPLAEIAPDVRHPQWLVTIRRLCAHRRGQPEPGRPLTGLTALITGATSGIGKAIGEALAADGAWVVVHGRDPQRADLVVESLRRHDVYACPLLADLRVGEHIAPLAQSAWSMMNGLDVLICNAGADTLTGAAAAWPFERKLAELWAVDVHATMQLARDIGARMQQRGRGTILTMGWDQADTGMAGDSGQLFATVKGAVMAFTRSLALTLAPQVRVNCLAPGWIKTAWGEQASEVWQQRAVRETPLGRWGLPQDVANVARWLCSPAAAFVTGQIIRSNGGAVR